MKKGYEFSLEEFQQLLEYISRHHIYQIANELNLKASSREKKWRFLDLDGAVIPINEVYRRIQKNPQSKRSVYNLWMGYFR
jgi:hypothetical protein